MRRPVCLVTGATGALGPAVVAALGRTHDIRTLTRRPAPPGLFDPSVVTLTGDILDAASVRRALAGADAVVHLAARLHLNSPAPGLREEYVRVNVEGTAAIVEAARAEGVSRLVLMSSIAVYGGTGARVIDEDAEPRPETFYAETKLAAERCALLARGPDGTAMTTVLRSAAVYGPRVKGNYRLLADAIARRRFVPIGRGVNRRTLVFEADLASAVALALGHPAAAGRIYNVSDGRVHAMRDIIGAIHAALGRRPPSWHLPVTPVRLAVRVASLFAHRLPAMLETYLEDVAVRALRIQQELGFRPHFDLERGWRASLGRSRQGG